MKNTQRESIQPPRICISKNFWGTRVIDDQMYGASARREPSRDREGAVPQPLADARGSDN
jgi:hypothetical protein